MKTSLHGFMKAGLLDYDTKVREQWVGCHPGQVKLFVWMFVLLVLAISRPILLGMDIVHENAN